ncbi:class I SAM-dependent methyltransferase [Synechococcus sp. CS-602]|uniref:class I SAM-dependent methyltransferase n=1 Tax=Synechococcus sp. CS-602 TaxID=2847982 RepID=UPI00223BF5FE|nr:class I SAM-dependent methyltransferase [Synechococcus sp. CS-602]
MLGKILSRLITGKPRYRSAPKIEISSVISYEDYINIANDELRTDLINLIFEKKLALDSSKQFAYNGYCYVFKAFVDFIVDYDYAYKVDNILMPNWRERLACPVCHLNNRMRAAVHIFRLETQANENAKIYITEQTTILCKLFQQSYKNTCGSEYLGELVRRGSSNSNGIRNEDLTNLSFNSNRFDAILSFDVLEHIPNYKKALEECYRCIKPGGSIFISAPFELASKKNIMRAYLCQAGGLVHLLPPEYHGDPINPEGCLCFYHFGWDILDDLREVGFSDAKALLYWSKEFGYLGGEQLILVAQKE